MTNNPTTEKNRRTLEYIPDDEEKKEILKSIKKKTSYTMTYICSNCGTTFTQEFESGQIAEQGECPHCGVSPKKIRWEGYIRKIF